MKNQRLNAWKTLICFLNILYVTNWNVIQTHHAFRGWNELQSQISSEKRSDRTVRSKQISIKDLFNDLLNQTKGFKYQITLKVTLEKYKSTEIEFAPVYFNSTTITVTNERFSQEILYRVNNWIIEGSGWIVELIEYQYINIWTYRHDEDVLLYNYLLN